MASSEEDVLGDVFASNRDRGADFAAPEPPAKEELKPEAPSEQPKLDATDEQKPTEEDGSKQQYRDPETGRFVPLHELKSERTKRQEEARLREEAEKRASNLEAELKTFREQQQRQLMPQHQAPPVQQVQRPDPFVDPEGFADWQRHEMQRSLYESRVAMSDAILRDKLKDYDKTVDLAIMRLGNDPAFTNALVNHPLPGQYAYEQGKRILALERVGSDPDAYEERIRKEEREKVLAELKAGGARSPQQQPQRFPGTLADATASGGQGAILTEEAMMADIFSSGRQRRRA